MIWEYSGGIPRKINMLCDNTLLIGYGLKKKKINAAIVQEAAGDLKWERSSKSEPPLEISPEEAVIPVVEKKPPRRRLSVAITMLLVGGFMFLGSFFLSRMGFQFIGDANTKNVPIESFKPKAHTKNEGETDLTTPAKVEEKIRQVVVKQGDSLASIIHQTYGVYNDVILNKVLQENPEVISPKFILPGQVINLPVAKEHMTIKERK
jgi:nucleoid-associated protein YgaU